MKTMRHLRVYNACITLDLYRMHAKNHRIG